MLATTGGVAFGSVRSTPRLVGKVGPGHTISLVNARGRRVKTLRPGMYRFVIKDRSAHDNFHLSGPGVSGFVGVTSIPYRGTTTWTLRLSRGTYRYRSDAHPRSMHGSFRVT